MGLSQSKENVIRRHYDFLVDRMSPEFGLVEKLYSNRTISVRQKSEIEVESLIHRRNEILLKHIVEKKACKELFEALKECGQSHLVKYMEERGVYRPEFGGNWPLPEKESTLLLANYENLVDILDSRELVGILYQTGVLNQKQRNLVTSRWTTAEQNRVLLEILRKGSLDGYWQMIRCLHLSNQSHIARIFESGGVVVRIDANLPPRFSNHNELENSLVTKISELLHRTSIPGVILEEFTNLLPFIPDERLEETYQNLLAVAAKRSVSFYFLCSNQGDVDRLRRLASDGQLKGFVEDLFNRLMEFPSRIKVSIRWSRDDFSKSRKYVEEIQARNSIDEPMKTTIQCLPLELLDTVLQSAYLWFRLQSGELKGDKDSDFIKCLTSVDRLWLRRIQKKRFKRSIWPQLERIFRRKFELYFSFRGCLRYLEEAIQVKEVKLTRRDLLDFDFLADLLIKRQLRKNGAKFKSHRQSVKLAILAEEILHVRRGLERENIYNAFIRCLRRTKQMNEARVLEQEGTTVKVEIRQPKNIKTDSWSREFSSRLNKLKDRNHLKSDDKEIIIQQLKDSDFEILSSFEDRGVIVWIWCKSQNALESLKSLQKSQTLIDHLHLLGSENDREKYTRDIHLEELNQLNVDKIPLQNLVINVEGKIEVEETHHNRVIGVTKLRSKIFVLGRYKISHLFIVFVFDDQYPFGLRAKMAFEEIKYANDISSSEKNLCLYIADPMIDYVWRISLQDEDKIDCGKFTCTALKCLELSKFFDFGMTFTDGGQILILGKRNPIFLFCESESALNNPIRIDLPADIERPVQVAENSAGNFIFLYRTGERLSAGGRKDPWVVSEVGRDGKTIIRRHLGTGSEWLHPAGLPFLLVDSKDRIFLADRIKHKLILLDSRLRYVRSFTLDIDEEEDDENRILYPWKMFFDGGNNQLIVAGWRTIVVYSISNI